MASNVVIVLANTNTESYSISVHILTRLQAARSRNRASIPGGSKKLIFSLSIHTGSEVHPAFYLVDIEVVFLGLGQLRSRADRSHLTSAEISNTWSCKSSTHKPFDYNRWIRSTGKVVTGRGQTKCYSRQCWLVTKKLALNILDSNTQLHVEITATNCLR